MRTNVADEHKPDIGFSTVLGALLILLGILAIAFPWISTLAVTIFIAWVLIFRSILELADAFGSRQLRGAGFKVLIGALSLIAGVLLLVYPFEGVLTLTLILALFLLLEGVLETVMAFQLRPLPRWGWLLFDGILTMALGLLIWLSWPSSAPWAIGLLVGIAIISTGVARLITSGIMNRELRTHRTAG